MGTVRAGERKVSQEAGRYQTDTHREKQEYPHIQLIKHTVFCRR